MRIQQKKRQRKILLLVESIAHYGRSIIKGIDRYAAQNDWEITYEPRGLEDPLPRWLESWDGDGVISRLGNVNSAKRLQQTGLPIVQLAGNQTSVKVDVLVHEQLLAKMAADHLLGYGYQQFAYYSYGTSWWSFDRGHVFAEEMRKRGYECSCFRSISGSKNAFAPKWSLDERKRLQKWLLHLPKPVAIFTARDTHAQEVLLVCRQHDLSVPNEVAVLGIDDDPWFCHYLVPTLSSIDINGFQIGWEAAVLLDNLLKGRPRPAQPITVPPLHVSIRQSTDAVAVSDPDFAAALRFLRQSDTLCTSVAGLVQEVGLSQKTLERRFQQYLGSTPEQEIMRIRIERSKILLRETSFSVESIGLKTGFSSQGHFIETFKRRVGMTPSRYRLQARSS